MKIIPYLRLAWAAQMIITAFSRNEVPLNFISGLTGLTFILYCIIIGIQEIKNKHFIETRFFYIFGAFFEVLIFLAGLYVLKLTQVAGIEAWRIALLIFWQIVLMAIIIVDIRRLWTN
jgi:hypothetical protein